MLAIGIESSAHTFGVGIIKNGRIIANEKSSYDVGTRGMIPSKVAEFHIKNAKKTVELALKNAGVSIGDIDGVGYTKGPGIGPCLQVGELTAKTIAARLGVDIVPVHHGIAHIEIAKKFARLNDPVVLYVSGGNSQILKLVKRPSKHYAVLGETFDIGIGNMLDNFARSIGLNPAWGSSVAKLAEGGRYIPLPYTVKGTDFAFTGLLTSAVKKVGSASPKDIAFSLQETAFSMLCEATERTLLLTNSNELCVCGGVAQSKRLKEMLSEVAKENSARFGYAPDEFNADNGAMIAYVAEKLLEKGISVPVEKCGIEQKYRIDKGLVW